MDHTNSGIFDKDTLENLDIDANEEYVDTNLSIDNEEGPFYES